MIPKRRLGPNGALVGAVGLGCMGMSWAYTESARDDETSIAVIRRALDLGVTLLDTAQIYGPFSNEEVVGRAVAGRRDEAVVATKTGLALEDRPGGLVVRNGRPEYVRASLDESLKRLGTDHVDLYYLHRVDPDVPLEETWGALAETVAAGKALQIGLSEVTVEQAELAQAIHPVAAIQSEFSLWTQGPAADILPWCAGNGATFVPFSPLGRGFLTGQVTSSEFESNDFRASNPRFTAEAMAANQAIVDAVLAIAAGNGATAGQVAIAWTLAQGDYVVPIPGTKRLPYLEENTAAADVRLSSTDLAALSALPAPVGDRYAAS